MKTKSTVIAPAGYSHKARQKFARALVAAKRPLKLALQLAMADGVTAEEMVGKLIGAAGIIDELLRSLPNPKGR